MKPVVGVAAATGVLLAAMVSVRGVHADGWSLLPSVLAAQTATPPQQSVPDAPRPQTLPAVNSLTPVAPAVTPPATRPAASSTATPSGTPPVASDDGPALSTSLPAAPSSSSARDVDQDAAPEIPAAGQAGNTVYRLGTVNVNFVDIPFTVKDSKGQLVPGLSYRDVRIYENGLRQKPVVFTNDPIPLSVALVIDQSVTFDTMAKINSALGALQGAFTSFDEVAIFTYNNGVKQQTDFTAAQSNRLGVILERSKGQGREPLTVLGGPLSQTTNKNNQNVDPNTAPVVGHVNVDSYAPREYHTLNDAILEAARATTKAGRDRRRVVFVISDGKEYGSKAKTTEVVRYLQTNSITLYATLVGDASLPGIGFLDRIHLPLTMRDDILPRYAALTGGQCDPEFRPRGIENSFADISKTVRTQYTIGYYSHESSLDSKYRSLDVRVLRPNLTVIAKTGYYPNARDSRPSAPAPATGSSTTRTPSP